MKKNKKSDTVNLFENAVLAGFDRHMKEWENGKTDKEKINHLKMILSVFENENENRD